MVIVSHAFLGWVKQHHFCCISVGMSWYSGCFPLKKVSEAEKWKADEIQRICFHGKHLTMANRAVDLLVASDLGHIFVLTWPVSEPAIYGSSSSPADAPASSSEKHPPPLPYNPPGTPCTIFPGLQPRGLPPEGLMSPGSLGFSTFLSSF